MDATRSPGGDRGRGDPEDALHPGIDQVWHPEGHPLRQHPWQVQEDDDTRRGRPRYGRGNGRARVLLRHQRQSVQSAHEKVSERYIKLRRAAQAEARSRLRVRRTVGLPLVVGLLQEALDSLALFQRRERERGRLFLTSPVRQTPLRLIAERSCFVEKYTRRFIYVCVLTRKNFTLV